MSKHHHHHKHHSFRVTWDGKTIAGVDRVSPLTRLVEVITYRTGPAPHDEHTAPGRVTSAPTRTSASRSWIGTARRCSRIAFTAAG
jgi:T4-like virus tail tube protein gp19